jgi:hypothetical protein
MPGELQPLASNFAIVDADGKPNQYFIRWAQQRQIDIAEGITIEQAQALIDDWAAARHINTTAPIVGGGPLSGDLTLTHAASGVVAGTYGDGTHVPQITVDAKGHVTGVVNVAVSGGGGGGIAAWLSIPQVVDYPNTAEATATGSYSGTPSQSLNAWYVDNFYWNASAGSQEYLIDFAGKIVLTGIMACQNVTSDQGTWQVSASNDGVTFTNLGLPANWGASGLYSPFIFINTTAYRFYKLTKTSGSTASAPFQRWFLVRATSVWTAITGTTPVIRGSKIASSSASSYTITWPTGTVAGDTVYFFGGHGYNYNLPAGWNQASNLAGSNFNGAVFWKVMTAGDIATGSVTVTTAGAYNGVQALISFAGTVFLRSLTASRNGGGSPTISLPSVFTAQINDMILYWGSNRGVSANTVSLGATLQTVTATEASGILTEEVAAVVGSVSPTFGYPTAGSGNYQAVLALYA